MKTVDGNEPSETAEGLGSGIPNKDQWHKNDFSSDKVNLALTGKMNFRVTW